MKTPEDGKTSHVYGFAECCEKSLYNSTRIQCNSHQNPNVILHRNRKILYGKYKSPINRKSNPEQKSTILKVS
jgi:hypothetical protein